MLITYLLYLLSSNAVTNRRDKSILYARLVLTILVSCFILAIASCCPNFHNKGLGIFSAQYQTTAITQIFHIFAIMITILILLIMLVESLFNAFPLIGFFAKQMVLSSALDNGYIFVTFIAILASVISACYYLALINQIFFQKSDYQLNPALQNITMTASIVNRRNVTIIENLQIQTQNTKLTTSLTVTISVLTLIILLFILNPQEWLNMSNILALIIFTN